MQTTVSKVAGNAAINYCGAKANHVNTLKTHYNNVLGSIYKGIWLFKVIESLTGVDYTSQLDPVDPKIYSQIINNKYAIN